MLKTYTARWIFPIDAPPIERGVITIAADKIVAVEPHSTRTADVDLGNVAILPGFVNAHTHLDLSGARGQSRPTDDFTQWLRQVIAFRRSQTVKDVQGDTAAGLAESLRFGTTLLGDISAAGGSWDLIAQAPCRAVVYYELLGLTAAGMDRSWDVAAAWITEADEPGLRVRGLSPHAPYSVHRALFELANVAGKPLATHLAESHEELHLLTSRSGPFVDFLKEMNVWNPDGLIIPEPYLSRFLPGIFVHGNYLDQATTFLPSQTLVICPRTHTAFGHPHHPFPHFLQRGVRVALGTDSLASNPDLDILAEARFLRRHYPEVEPAMLLRMLTLSGAEALGFGGIAGSLTPGKSADLVVMALPDVTSADPHDLVLDSSLPVQEVMFRGEWLRV
jgi:aminodeoxyfutalosine deaminase